ncbi:MAG: hypothetical protein LBT38_08380 [Deltaproteobacteria bacterium]|jgi:hypothetical protein|nr:hypothetical protein [Deltaproteobacteria bacterium]
MNLNKNPFNLINASVFDNSGKLAELVSEMGITLNHKVLSKIRDELLDSPKRLTAELAWLPGLNETRDQILILNTKPDSFLNAPQIPPLARANLLTAALQTQTPPALNYILAITQAVEEIDPPKILAGLNTARQVAGFPLIKPEKFNVALENQQLYLLETIETVLAKLEPVERLEAIATLVSAQTDLGQKPATALLTKIVNHFALETQIPLSQRAHKVYDHIYALYSQIGPNSSPAQELKNTNVIIEELSQLVKATKCWDELAQPFQILDKSQGKNHHDSQIMALKIRELAFYAYNAQGYLSLAQGLTKLLSEVFAEVVDVAKQAEEDQIFLSNLAKDPAIKNHDPLGPHLATAALGSLMAQIKKAEELAKTNPFDLKKPIEELAISLQKILAQFRDQPRAHKVALAARSLALSLFGRLKGAQLALPILKALSEGFAGQAPYDSLFASDVKTIERQASDQTQKPPSKFHLAKWQWAVIALIIVILLVIGLKLTLDDPSPTTEPKALTIQPVKRLLNQVP